MLALRLVYGIKLASSHASSIDDVNLSWSGGGSAIRTEENISTVKKKKTIPLINYPLARY